MYRIHSNVVFTWKIFLNGFAMHYSYSFLLPEKILYGYVENFWLALSFHTIVISDQTDTGQLVWIRSTVLAQTNNTFFNICRFKIYFRFPLYHEIDVISMSKWTDMIKAFNILPTTNKQFKFIISALDIVKKIEFSDVMSNRVQNCIFLVSKSMNKGCTKDIYIH